jgi:Tol biopolymer transport system component
MSPEATRVTFQSRASNLTENDANTTWDVFVRDLTSGTTLLASVGTNGLSGAGASTDPWISADGRAVLFTSEARNLTPVTGSLVRALYLRDLSTAQTVWVSQDLTGLGDFPSRTLAAALSASGRFSVFGASGRTNQLFRRDVELGRTVRLSSATTVDPPELRSAPLVFERPVLSDDAGFAACRFSLGRTNGFLWFDVGAASETAFGRGTNAPPTRLPTELLGPAMSAEGRSLAYAQPVRVPGKTDAVLQVFRWRGPGTTPDLVSGHLGSQDVSDGHAFAPQITPDGRFVAFLSYATDLVPGTVAGALGAYVWDGQTGGLALVADLGSGALPGALSLSANGAWLGIAAPTAGGTAVVHLYEVATGQATAVPLPPLADLSTSARGWSDVRAEGVSADGRYVALVAFPPPAGGTNHVQVYRLDTQAGTRRLITEGLNGALATRHSAAPALSGDGSVILWWSAAANLVDNDVNSAPDLFAETLATGQRRLLRTARVPSNAGALPDGYLSSDGAVAFIKFAESTRTVGRIANVESGAVSLPFTGVVKGAASFADQGRWIAISRDPGTSGLDFRVEVYNPAACLAATISLPSPLWRSPTASAEPALSADGKLLAYLILNSAGTNAIVVTDWALNRPAFARQLPSRVVPSGLRLSADGHFVTWLASSSAANSATQVWRGDVSSGATLLVSVASDGVSEADGSARSTAISPDGRYVAFASLAGNLVAGDDNGVKDVFLRDLESGQTLLVSRTPSGKAGAGWSLQPCFSRDGQSLFFVSSAPDLAVGDYNQAADLFKVDLLSASGPLAVIRRNLSTGRVELLWNGQAGRKYRIEYKDDVSSADWLSLPGEFAGDVPVELDPPSSSCRLYRLRAL